jgi:drug/metabolite transporter (DMT)-like permease
LIAFAAGVSYFTIVPRWPDLRDAGHWNVGLAAVGFVVTLLALVPDPRPGRGRWPRLFGVGLAALSAAFLAFYVYYLSYQMPPAERALAVGEEAPLLRLRDQEGRERSLEEWRGRAVVLVFFRGHW